MIIQLLNLFEPLRTCKLLSLIKEKNQVDFYKCHARSEAHLNILNFFIKNLMVQNKQ
jgi:hypothetical protein